MFKALNSLPINPNASLRALHAKHKLFDYELICTSCKAFNAFTKKFDRPSKKYGHHVACFVNCPIMKKKRFFHTSAPFSHLLKKAGNRSWSC
jgi:hypothetical protein